MTRLSLAAASALGFAGLALFAAPARADDVHLEFGVGFRDGRARGGYLGVGVETPFRAAPAPRVVAEPAPYFPSRPTGPAFGGDPTPWARDGARDRDGRDFSRTYVPPHLELRSETVCEPAIYEDRPVPVFEDRCVPIFDEVCIPIFEERSVKVIEWVIDARTGRRHEVVVGTRIDRVKVGERKERVKVGERHEQVQVGTRLERVLVRAEITRVVQREVWVPGRYVMSRADGFEGSRFAGHDGRHFDRSVRMPGDVGVGVGDRMSRPPFESTGDEVEPEPTPRIARR